MRQKRSVIERIEKSREAMLAAVQIYNNPQITFKAEAFITLSVIAWTYLIHGYYRSENIEFRYCRGSKTGRRYDKTKRGAYKYWELERCLNDRACPFDSGTKTNLLFLIGVRHEIEHQLTDRIDEFISAKLQACALNYEHWICELFGKGYSVADQLAVTIQFSSINPSQAAMLHSSKGTSKNILNYVASFEDALEDEVLLDSRYAYRVLFTPLNANRRGQADQVIEFIPADSPMAEGIETQYTLVKETEKNKYRPSDIVNCMKDEGFKWFTIPKHTDLWKNMDAKSPEKHFGVEVSKTWYWYDSWLKFVKDYCIKESHKRI